MEEVKLDLLEKNDNMTNYYFFRNYFNDEQIGNIKEIAEMFPVIDGNVSGKIDKSYRTSSITWIPLNEMTKPLYESLLKLMKKANKDMWKFHITDMKDSLQFTEYLAEENGHYDWHLDFGGGRSSTRKLSMVVQLSDPDEYVGGKLQFMINRDIIDAPMGKGTVIFFPSYLMHRVTRVESGRRNSLVCWFHGPPFI